MKKLALLGIWLFALASSAVNAAPVTYTFSFTPSAGLQPTGHFTYDAVAAINSRFSAFTVNASSLVVDFSEIANFDVADSIGGCGIPRTSAVLFAYLHGSCGARAYQILDLGTVGAVELSASAQPGFSQLGTGTSAAGAGAFTIRQSSPPLGVPEPSTVWLALGALAAVAGFAKRRS